MSPIRRRVLAVATALAAASGLVPGTLAAARAEPVYDWFLLTVTGGPAGVTNLRVVVSATGSHTGAAPYVLGVGTSVDGTPTYLRAFNFGLGPSTISTSRDAGGVRVDLAPGKQLNSSYEHHVVVGALDPGETFAVLQFQTGVANAAPTVTTTIGSGAATVDIVNGSGSEAVTAGDPADGGVSANVDGIGAGAVVATRVAAAGIAGAAVSHCNACRGSWAAPDGRTGGWAIKGHEYAGLNSLGVKVATPEVDVGATGFAGPGGQWAFRWDGVDDVSGNNPAEIAYAPLGDAWPLFDTSVPRPSDGCAGGDAAVQEDNAAARVTMTTSQPSADEVRVCVRVEDPVSHAGAGGRLVVTSGGPGSPVTPTVGDGAGACAVTDPPNQLPAPHPFMDQSVLGQRVFVDAHQSGSRAVLCLAVDGVVAAHVVVPFAAGVASVAFHPDAVEYSVW